MDHRNWKGLLLRSERIRQNKGQKEICIGCCVPSYLSKIEHGQAEPAEELLKELFRRLHIHYETDTSYLAACQSKMDEIFRRILYGLEYGELARELKKEELRLLYSPLRISFLLVGGFSGEKEMLTLLREVVFGMNREQEGFYYLLEGRYAEEAGKCLACYQQADSLLHHSYTMLMTGFGYLYTSNYTAIHNLENHLITTALEEGNIYTIAQYYLLNGTAYGSLDMDEMMLSYYNRVIRMYENTGWKDVLNDVYYNIGSVYLSQQRFEEAGKYLDLIDRESFIIWHKKALLAIRKKDRERGKACLEQMQSYLTESAEEYYRVLYEEACMELDENYLDNPEYEKLLDQLIDILEKHAHFGYLYFFRDTITQAYIARRKYKKAMDFQIKISRSLINK